MQQFLTCEHPNCTEKSGQDYRRTKNLFGWVLGWQNEPIYLCDKHSIGYTPCNNQTIVVTKPDAIDTCIQQFKKQ